jgi:hypothetical protein
MELKIQLGAVGSRVGHDEAGSRTRSLQRRSLDLCHTGVDMVCRTQKVAIHTHAHSEIIPWGGGCSQTRRLQEFALPFCAIRSKYIFKHKINTNATMLQTIEQPPVCFQQLLYSATNMPGLLLVMQAASWLPPVGFHVARGDHEWGWASCCHLIACIVSGSSWQLAWVAPPFADRCHAR